MSPRFPWKEFAMGAAVLLLAMSTLSATPVEAVVKDHVDLVEINHFYDEQGRLVFDQVIFYDWSDEKMCYTVRAWRLLKKREQAPVRDWKTGHYRAVWRDGGTWRDVTADSFRETWTQHDPELVNRKFLPKEDRRDLVKIRPAK